MKKAILAIVCAITFAGCTLDWHVDKHCGPGTNRTCGPAPATPTVYAQYDSPVCWDEPYHYEPEWCDFYDDGVTCCVWQADGWLEEYCQWSNDFCWDYNGSW